MTLFGGLKNLIKSASEMIFPACCEVCGRSLVDGEDLLCLSCDFAMPRTNIEDDEFNFVHQRLARPGMPIEKAASYFFYVKDNAFARMIQAAKYNYRPEIAQKLGERFAKELSSKLFFDQIDLILPMPLHPIKRLKRGYNQTEEIAKGISSVSGLPVGDHIKMRRHRTQTKLSAEQRRENMKNMISVSNAEELEGLHVLIVDDIITTGATMMAAVEALQTNVKSVRVSVLSLGLTRM